MVDRFEQLRADPIAEKILDITGLRPFDDITFTYHGQDITFPEYIGQCGPMARAAFEDLSSRSETDPEFHRKKADVEQFAANFLSLKKDEHGEWARADRNSR
ncbi:MAG: hypothetical protein M3Q14_02380 [bacterium]|nr:hypothetical protein [bacterium]